jgi:hypothetical protein
MKNGQRIASRATGVGLVAVTIVFSIPVNYLDVYWTIAFLQLAIVLVAAWFAGGKEIFGVEEGRRRLAVAGLLLIAPFVLFALLPGLGPPDSLADHSLEQRRFASLLIDALTVCGGCFVLRDILADEGERLFSTLAAAAAGMSAPLYVMFAAIQLADYRELERKGVGAEQQAFSTLDEVSIVLLFFGSALNYLAAIGFAQALFTTGKLTRRARTLHVLIGATALSFLIFRGLNYGSLPRALQHWYTTVAFFAGVPAISWVLLSALGVALLSRAGGAQAPTE